MALKRQIQQSRHFIIVLIQTNQNKQTWINFSKKNINSIN